MRQRPREQARLGEAVSQSVLQGFEAGLHGQGVLVGRRQVHGPMLFGTGCSFVLDQQVDGAIEGNFLLVGEADHDLVVLLGDVELCLIREEHAAADDGEAWNAFRERIFAKYPGKRTADDLTEWTVTDEGEVPGPKAKDELSKVEIWNRSLLSAPCDTLI